MRAEHPADGHHRAAALRTTAFWILACITILSAFSENGLVTNLPPSSRNMEFSPPLRRSLSLFAEPLASWRAWVSALQSTGSPLSASRLLFWQWWLAVC